MSDNEEVTRRAVADFTANVAAVDSGDKTTTTYAPSVVDEVVKAAPVTKSSNNSVAKSNKKAASSSSQGSVVAAAMDSLSERFPKYKPHIDKATPILVKAGDLLDNAYPYMRRAYFTGEQYWEKLQPYNPAQFSPLILGLIICFFGGSYLTLIAAIECVRLVVWQRMFAAFKVLVENYNAAYEASKRDDLIDDDNNGVADVLEISKKELLTRKIYLFFRTVKPDQVTEALSTIWMGLLSVVATLRVNFAQAVTLGCSLGEICDCHCRKYLEPAMGAFLPDDLAKWAPVASGYIFRFLGCMLAWMIKRFITGFHAAMRGADMFVTNAIILAKKSGYVNESFDTNGPQASALISLVAFVGFYWQVSNNFGLPFPLNILMFPASVVEWVLSTWVALI